MSTTQDRNNQQVYTGATSGGVIVGLFDHRSPSSGHLMTHIDTQYPEAMRILGKLC